MVDEWKEVKQQMQDQREIERDMLSRVRGLHIHEYYTEEAIDYTNQLWLKKRVKK
jgi:hypothetical protein